jgi:hypothetical protein
MVIFAELPVSGLFDRDDELGSYERAGYDSKKDGARSGATE